MTPSSTATISKDQRDGLYALVRNHLGGLSDVFVEMEQRRDFDAAERLGREFAEDFRLLEDIGWQPNDGRESVVLTMPLGELLELLQRLQDEAEHLLTESPAERRSKEEDEKTNRRFRLGLDACEALWPTSIAKAADPVEPSPEVAARFAKNLRRCRERAGLSQEELGYRAQLHRTQVGSLERGVRTPRIDTVLRLAGSLSAPVSDLLAGLEWTPGYVEIVGGGFEIAERPELKAA